MHHCAARYALAGVSTLTVYLDDICRYILCGRSRRVHACSALIYKTLAAVRLHSFSRGGCTDPEKRCMQRLACGTTFACSCDRSSTYMQRATVTLQDPTCR